MALTDEQIEMMKEDLSAELIELLMKDWHYSQIEALEVLYNSDTFDRLPDKRTGWYYQSAGYVYSFLQQELTMGDFRQ